MKSFIFIIILIATCLILTNPTLEDYSEHIKQDIIKGFPEDSQATGVLAARTVAGFILEATIVKNYYLFSTFQFNAADLEIDLDGFPNEYRYVGILKRIVFIPL